MRIIHIKPIFQSLVLGICIYRTTPRVIDHKSYTEEAVKSFFSFDFESIMNKKDI